MPTETENLSRRRRESAQQAEAKREVREAVVKLLTETVGDCHSDLHSKSPRVVVTEALDRLKHEGLKCLGDLTAYSRKRTLVDSFFTFDYAGCMIAAGHLVDS